MCVNVESKIWKIKKITKKLPKNYKKNYKKFAKKITTKKLQKKFLKKLFPMITNRTYFSSPLHTNHKL